MVTACGRSGSGNNFRGRFQGNQASSVEVTPVGRETISRQVINFGTIKSSDVVKISPQVGNRVTRIRAFIGDTVRQGQILCDIFDRTYRDQLTQNEAQLAQARSNLYRDSLQYVRQKELYQRKLVSQSDYETARASYLNSRAQFSSAQATVQQSRQNLAYTEVRSPVYGVVTQRNVAQGDVVSPGQVIYEVNNLLGLESRLYLPMQDWQEVQTGQKVTFYLTKDGAVVAEGRVTRKSPQLDPTTGLGEVVVSLNEAGNTVSPGMLCRAVVDVQTKNNAIVVPRDALVENVQTFIDPESNTIQLKRSYAAYVVENDTMAIQRPLQLGIQQGNRIEVLSGLRNGDRLIVTGQNGLQDSSKVRIVTPSMLQVGTGNTGNAPSSKTNTSHR